MPRSILFIVALILILTTGFVHGMWTGRWLVSHALEEATGRLNRAPNDIGNWKASSSEIDANILARARATGSWVRTYRHEDSNEVLTVILLCGRAGPMSVHRPEHCYNAAGYDSITATVRTTVSNTEGGTAEIRTAVFGKPGPEGASSLRVFWSWYTGS